MWFIIKLTKLCWFQMLQKSQIFRVNVIVLSYPRVLHMDLLCWSLTYRWRIKMVIFFSSCFGNGSAPNKWQTINWTHGRWSISVTIAHIYDSQFNGLYMLLGLNELMIGHNFCEVNSLKPISAYMHEYTGSRFHMFYIRLGIQHKQSHGFVYIWHHA